jgi:hypothetical protein
MPPRWLKKHTVCASTQKRPGHFPARADVQASAGPVTVRDSV